ncbi:MAG TPA: type IV toxin-antitoxin system AbiEi family antitoxin domain-containing protein [Tahibacter sp.]|nr:type IV toxin-antitoxin system AbiEi family antitoxin domain-containing protein [Tahibacter sp.]
MAQVRRDRLKRLMTGMPNGTPVDTADLAAAGVSTDLAAYYVRHGWLERLAHGVYVRAGDTLSLHATLVFLQRRLVALRVGGKSALDWHGIRHYVAQRATLQLYGWNSAQLPTWFTARFPAHYRRQRLFDETPDSPLYAGPFEARGDAPRVSSPERAFLEMLGEVGTRQSLSEATELAESLYTLRAKVMSELLRHCTSVKTRDLALRLGLTLNLPWFAKLAPEVLALDRRHEAQAPRRRARATRGA